MKYEIVQSRSGDYMGPLTTAPGPPWSTHHFGHWPVIPVLTDHNEHDISCDLFSPHRCLKEKSLYTNYGLTFGDLCTVYEV